MGHGINSIVPYFNRYAGRNPSCVATVSNDRPVIRWRIVMMFGLFFHPWPELVSAAYFFSGVTSPKPMDFRYSPSGMSSSSIASSFVVVGPIGLIVAVSIVSTNREFGFFGLSIRFPPFEQQRQRLFS